MALSDIAGETTLTGKNQISLPARGVRQLGWARGDRLIVHVLNQDTMLLTRRPDNPADYYAGKLGHVFGTHEENIRFLEEERASWEPAPVEEEMEQPKPKTARAPKRLQAQRSPGAHK